MIHIQNLIEGLRQQGWRYDPFQTDTFRQYIIAPDGTKFCLDDFLRTTRDKLIEVIEQHALKPEKGPTSKQYKPTHGGYCN